VRVMAVFKDELDWGFLLLTTSVSVRVSCHVVLDVLVHVHSFTTAIDQGLS
jgi:hypothetical protein